MNQHGANSSSPAQRALQRAGHPFASPAKPKLKSRPTDVFRAPAAPADTSTQQQFETQPAKRSVLKPTVGASRAIQPTSTPKKQTTFPLTSSHGKQVQSPGARQKSNPGFRARVAKAVAPSQTHERYVAQPAKGTATKAINMITDEEDTTSSSDSDEDVPLVPTGGCATAHPGSGGPVDLTGDSSDDGQANGNDYGDMDLDEPAEEHLSLIHI